VATIREIKNRVVAIKKTQKITSAMKMISAARLARAQQAAEASRAYGAKLTEIFSAVAAGIEPDANPLLSPRTPVRKLDIVVFTSDRGLCGAFNSNVIKQALSVMNARIDGVESISVIPVGRRARDYFRRLRIDMPNSWIGLSVPLQPLSQEIASFLIERYLSGAADEVIFVYGRFVSALTQVPTAVTAIPVLSALPENRDAPTISYEIEPSAESLLATVLPSVVQFMVLRALLENAASEHGARMTSMESATENTKELIRSFTLEMNKARQSQITTELTEIVAGAEAL
jgi:F-type H+-transporting ATPase subunit gamma